MSVLPLAHVDPLQCDEERLLQSTAALSTHTPYRLIWRSVSLPISYSYTDQVALGLSERRGRDREREIDRDREGCPVKCKRLLSQAPNCLFHILFS